MTLVDGGDLLPIVLCHNRIADAVWHFPAICRIHYWHAAILILLPLHSFCVVTLPPLYLVNTLFYAFLLLNASWRGEEICNGVVVKKKAFLLLLGTACNVKGEASLHLLKIAFCTPGLPRMRACNLAHSLSAPSI